METIGLTKGQDAAVETAKKTAAENGCTTYEVAAIRIGPESGHFGGKLPEGVAEVQFKYTRDGDDTQPEPGLEVTQFNPDGSVLSSQDFG